MGMTDNAKRILDNLIQEITTDRVATFVRSRLFGQDIEIPCHRWSLLNQFAVMCGGTFDARGFRQWEEAGRVVKKGSRALYILVPFTAKKKDEESEAADGERKEEPAKKHLATWFKAMPVFRVEDTEGKELDYEMRLREFKPDTLPLIDVARNLGIEVKPVLTYDKGGFFLPGENVIGMGSNNHRTFLHELSHAVDFLLPGKVDDKEYGEVVAELSSAFLGSLYGAQVELENTVAYIQGWAGKGHVAFKVMEAVGRVEQIYHYIENVKVAGKAA
jgi:antirestriction protein ArdC